MQREGVLRVKPIDSASTVFNAQNLILAQCFRLVARPRPFVDGLASAHYILTGQAISRWRKEWQIGN
jgi:hypothetical protein